MPQEIGRIFRTAASPSCALPTASMTP